jgi:hypothetical protein
MERVKWDLLEDNFAEVIEEINPANYDVDILIYAESEDELISEGRTYLERNIEDYSLDDDFMNSTEFNFIGKGYYSFNIMYNEFHRIDYILKNEINSAIYAMQDFPDSYWSDFEVTPIMYEILKYIDSME